MIQVPTNIGNYTDCWAGDSALLKDENLVRIARETGDWSALIVEGQTPTRFTMRVIPGHVFRKIADSALGEVERLSMLFRASCTAISGLEPFKFTTVKDRDYGVLASVDVTDLLDSVNINIVNELGSAAMNRSFLRPKL